jgi:hypothetical protein
MILSVVVPKLQKAQWERIEKEFKDVEYELIIHKDPIKALGLASGRFILFLEEDSAFKEGELQRSLDVFRFNESYRKLAMVSSAVDFDSIPYNVGFAYEDGVELTTVSGEDQYPVSIGYIYGAIMRTTAFRKAALANKKDPLYRSIQLSDYFWANGLRVEINPRSIYYAPIGYTPQEGDTYKIKNNSEALKVWGKEFIL